VNLRAAPRSLPDLVFGGNLTGERIPNAGEIEHESGHWALAIYGVDARQQFGLAVRPVDLHGAGRRIDHPSQLGAVGSVFPHLGAQSRQTVGLRAKFHDERGAKMPVTLQAFSRQLVDFFAGRPGSVRRTPGSVGKHKSGGRITDGPAPILRGPAVELAAGKATGPTEGGGGCGEAAPTAAGRTTRVENLPAVR